MVFPKESIDKTVIIRLNQTFYQFHVSLKFVIKTRIFVIYKKNLSNKASMEIDTNKIASRVYIETISSKSKAN